MQSDRYGDIADQTRGLRVVTPAGLLAHPARAEHVDRPERARDGAGQRGAPGDHLRGDDPRAPPAQGAHDPRLPVPDLGRVGRRHARHRRERGRAVGHARGRPRGDGVLVRHQEGLDAARQGAVEGAPALPDARKGFDLEQMCLGFIGYEGSERFVGAQRKAVGRIVSHHGGICIGSSPGRALRPEEVRHALHPRLPARPRRARRRVGDLGAVERRFPASTPRRRPPPATPSTSSASAAT